MSFDRSRALEDALRDVFAPARWTFVSFVHVESIVSRLPPGSRVMSIGGGARLATDRLLALRHPRLSLLGTDLACSQLASDLCPPNLVWRPLDILAEVGDASFDLVYSVECFEHIEDDHRAFSNALTFVHPKGSFLVIVPFATPRDQQDTATVEGERSRHGHIRPGYDPERLLNLVSPGPFQSIRLESCYWRHTSGLRAYRDEAIGTLGLELLPHVEALARFDIRPGQLANSRNEAQGIKLIATGKGAGDPDK